MIDWNYDLIRTINDHYKSIMNPSVDLMYFIRNFEEIYHMSLSDKVLLPDIFHDVMCYTLNGVNARHKILLTAEEEMIWENYLEEKRNVQLKKRHDAYDRGVDDYYKFMVNEVLAFVERYPFWDKLIIEKK